jgi:periplasmic divalent cation tolerance protein
MMTTSGEVLILTTVANHEQATALAHSLISKDLVACVTGLPGRSFYRWQSAEISEEPEIVLLLKTFQQKLVDIEALFKVEHPYEVPEFIVLKADQISAAYGEWMRLETKLSGTATANEGQNPV